MKVRDLLGSQRHGRVASAGMSRAGLAGGGAPEPGVARWQDRLDPLWSRLADGCHLNCRIADLISGGGFRIEALVNTRFPEPRTHTFSLRRPSPAGMTKGNA